MKGYFYITKNLINGKFYYGSSTVGRENTYLGSGSILEKAIDKYGRENFENIPLKYFETREEAYKFEDRFLKIYNLSSNSLCYNMKDSALGGNTIGNHPNRNSIVKKMSDSQKGKIKGSLSDSHKEKISISHQGLKQTDEHIESRVSKLRGQTRPLDIIDKISKSKIGHKVSDETKLKISNTLKKKGSISEETKQKISDSWKNRNPRKFSEIAKENMSLSRIGKKRGPYKKKDGTQVFPETVNDQITDSVTTEEQINS